MKQLSGSQPAGWEHLKGSQNKSKGSQEDKQSRKGDKTFFFLVKCSSLSALTHQADCPPSLGVSCPRFCGVFRTTGASRPLSEAFRLIQHDQSESVISSVREIPVTCSLAQIVFLAIELFGKKWFVIVC